jgi:xylan 1,4-beta-xylosidase
MAGSDPKYLRAFLSHCLRAGTPLDFLAFHAKGRPRHVDGHVRMGIAEHLATIDQGFATIASIPELKRTPIVIGESDPEGCAACQGPQLAYRNGTMYSSYTAASFARKHELAEKHGVILQGALTWAFEFEDQPYFAGFRALSTNGIALPVLNVFRMFSRMRGNRVAAESSARVPLEAILSEGVRGAPDVAALASREANRVAVLLWHYHDDDVPGPDAAVDLAVAGLPSGVAEAKLEHHRIDDHHGNAYAAWKRMGSPIAPDREQYRALEEASRLARLDGPGTVRVERGAATLAFTLPRQAVSLVTLEWP